MGQHIKTILPMVLLVEDSLEVSGVKETDDLIMYITASSDCYKIPINIKEKTMSHSTEDSKNTDVEDPDNASRGCTCDKCVSCCTRNPGWMSPEEATAAIKAGYAARMMRDRLYPDDRYGNDENIYILAPASQGCEGQDAPEPLCLFDYFMGWCKGRCTFLNAENRCDIHDSGFKPIQCREALACTPSSRTGREGNFAVARLWDTPEGRTTLALWEAALPQETP